MVLAGLERHCGRYPLAIAEDCGLYDTTAEFLRSDRKPLDYRHDMLADHTTYHKAQVFLGRHNLGVAGQSNRLIRWFMEETKADHLCLLNDDLIVNGDFVAFYREAHQDLGFQLLSFCDFNSETYRWVTVPARTPRRSYNVKVLPRMTGIMLSFSRALVERIGYFDTAFGKFGDEHSAPGGSLVACCDYKNRPIETIKEGDEILGWDSRPPNFFDNTLRGSKVLGVLKRVAPVVELTLASGHKLQCTPDHKWFYGAGYISKPLVVSAHLHVYSNEKPGYNVPSIGSCLHSGLGNNNTRWLNKIVAIDPVGDMEVYSLMTETGNYVADGYLSSNCDWNNRARFVGATRLNGQDLQSVDVELPSNLIQHQEIPSTISPEDKLRLDNEASFVMSRVSKSYATCDWYRPFRLVSPRYAGAYEHSGIAFDQLTRYPLIVGTQPKDAWI